jgi:hypothetical protein
MPLINHYRKVIIFLLGLLYAIFTHILQGYANFGDHSKYKISYESLVDVGVVEGYLNYNAQLGAGEPIYYLLTYIFSNLNFHFEIFNSILNFALVCMSIFILTRGGLAIIWIVLIIFPSYYLLVLNIDVIRLKVAIIFFIIALHLAQNTKFYFFSALSQFQIIAYFGAWFFSVLLDKLLRIITRKTQRIRINIYSILKYFILLLLLLFFALVFLNYFIEKIAHYSDQGSVFALLPLLIFPILIGFNFGFTSRKFYFLIPLVAMSFFVGSGRVTIMIYFAFLYMTSKLGAKKFLFLNIPFSVYYLPKTYLYTTTLIELGSGFEFIESN